MDTPWSHLPNAPLIDWVLQSLKTDPEKWISALDAAWDAAGDEAWNEAEAAAYNATRAAHRAAAYNATVNAALNTDKCLASNTNRLAARAATWSVNFALVAYDDCSQYLDLSYEQLLTYATLSERPQAVLLLPLKWVQEHECLVAST